MSGDIQKSYICDNSVSGIPLGMSNEKLRRKEKKKSLMRFSNGTVATNIASYSTVKKHLHSETSAETHLQHGFHRSQPAEWDSLMTKCLAAALPV